MHLEDDFTPNGPITQVPASWFNRVARFINNLIPGENVQFEKHDDGSPTTINIDTGCSSDTGTPTELGDLDLDDGMTAQTYSWTRGGSNGVTIHVMVEGESLNDQFEHRLYDAKLTFSKDGLLTSVTGGSGGIWIGA